MQPDAILEPFHVEGCFVLPMQSMRELCAVATTHADGSVEGLFYRIKTPDDIVHRRAPYPIHALGIRAVDGAAFVDRVRREAERRSGIFFVNAPPGKPPPPENKVVRWMETGAMDAAHDDTSGERCVWFVWWEDDPPLSCLNRTTWFYCRFGGLPRAPPNKAAEHVQKPRRKRRKKLQHETPVGTGFGVSSEYGAQITQRTKTIQRSLPLDRKRHRDVNHTFEVSKAADALPISRTMHGEG